MLCRDIVVCLSALAAVVSASPVCLDCSEKRGLVPRAGPGPGGFGGAGNPRGPPGAGGFGGGPGGGPGGPGGVGNPGPGTTRAVPTTTAVAATSAAAATTASATSDPVAVVSTSAAAVASASSASGVSPTLPVNGGSTELPSPTGTLKFIAVGHGIQNYTCASANATGTSTGALAVLYDVTSLFPGTSASSLSADDFNNLPSQVLENAAIPLNLNGSTGAEFASTNPPFQSTNSDLTINGLTLPFLAEHFFNSGASPTFDLLGSTDQQLFVGAKKAAVNAPSTADAGLLSTGAVAWVQLLDTGSSVGLTEVYRVETAGGNPTACTAAGQELSVPYAAQYWFFD